MFWAMHTGELPGSWAPQAVSGSDQDKACPPGVDAVGRWGGVSGKPGRLWGSSRNCTEARLAEGWQRASVSAQVGTTWLSIHFSLILHSPRSPCLWSSLPPPPSILPCSAAPPPSSAGVLVREGSVSLLSALACAEIQVKADFGRQQGCRAHPGSAALSCPASPRSRGASA